LVTGNNTSTPAGGGSNYTGGYTAGMYSGGNINNGESSGGLTQFTKNVYGNSYSGGNGYQGGGVHQLPKTTITNIASNREQGNNSNSNGNWSASNYAGMYKPRGNN